MLQSETILWHSNKETSERIATIQWIADILPSPRHKDEQNHFLLPRLVILENQKVSGKVECLS